MRELRPHELKYVLELAVLINFLSEPAPTNRRRTTSIPIAETHMRELRGVPIVGSGYSSSIPGSHPEMALLAKERRGHLRLDQRKPLPAATPEVRPRRAGKLGRRVSAPGGRFF